MMHLLVALASGMMLAAAAMAPAWPATAAAAEAAPATASSTAAPATAIEFVSADAVLRWIYAYRSRPEPSRLPAALRAASDAGALKDPDSAGIYVGFLAGLIAAQPATADRLIARLFPLPGADEWVIVRAIAWSGHPDWKGLLARAAPHMPQHALMVDRYATGALPTLSQLSIEDDPGWWDQMKGYLRFGDDEPKQIALDPSPEVIDALWGFYFASGDPAPLRRIAALLPWSKNRDKIERLTIGSMAKFTLAANASRDPALLATLKREVTRQPAEIAAILKDVIEAAETVEVGRVRREALAAIGELKRKEPGTKRELSFWGRLGEGAISLGCVAAAAVGQVALGLPCVVGGAASSAALHYFDTRN